MIILGDHKILLFVNLVLGNPWHQSYINCNLRQFRPQDLWPSAGVPITSSCWSRTSSTFRSLPLWRSAIYCQSSCFIPALQAYVEEQAGLKVEDASNAALFGWSAFVGEIVGRGFTFTGLLCPKAVAEEKENKKINKTLGKIEEEIDITVKNLNEKEELILLKEKEAAKSGCERLCLVSATAMAERSAALELGDLEEANTLLAEAEATDSEAKQLQQAHDLKEEEFENTAKQFISIELIANLGRRQLA
ncbi:hypothetical protein IFM89_028062 [Coptis chinensis]|uniref:Uncharacterized protein n=1 Tax=Coptis chinensis TaxID=261450 RepID=A0A835HG20_9MAGN|nr:hypothetical protein IFM89_028062 [Coptis chinensis]